MEHSITSIISSMDEAKILLEKAHQSISTQTGSTSILDLNKRMESIEDQTLSLIQLHQKIVSQKTELNRLLEEIGGCGGLAISNAAATCEHIKSLQS